MKPFAAFDLEIAKKVKNISNWPQEAPLGISCAAVKFEGKEDPDFHDRPRPKLDRHATRALVTQLLAISNHYQTVTWNGASFDYRVLAIESDRESDCQDLALQDIDMMFLVYCMRGHYLGLDKALMGSRLPTKVHNITLNDGTVIDRVTGATIPELWEAGEYNAVLTYLRGDIEGPVNLAKFISKNGFMGFVSKNGLVRVPMNLMTVEDAVNFNDRGTWATTKRDRKKFLHWIYDE